ncbi:MAG: alpha-L-rhamnosidase C-terminal domain-containing protein [Fimbriimonadaceae bacterium]
MRRVAGCAKASLARAAALGRDDVAYRLLLNDTFPSWGFTIKHGATSVWERWDGWTPERGFQDPGMNSFAHYAYGAVVGWMFQHVGGIRETSPGFASVRIEPKWNAELKFAKTRFDSVRGPISTEWREANGKFQLTVSIPPNVRAEVVLPDGSTRQAGSGTWTYTGPLPQ